MADNKDRDLTTRGLRTKAPKPNIIRIELLDGDSRERYLGTIQRGIDRVIKQPLYSRFGSDESVFYGFLKNSGNQTIGISSEWSKTGGVKGLLGDIKGGLEKFADAKESSVSKFISGATVSGINALDNIDKVAKSLSALDANITGNSTIKQINGVDISGFEVDCGWYLPEQLNLATTSLKVLSKMAYPTKVPSENTTKAINDWVDNLSKDNVDDNQNNDNQNDKPSPSLFTNIKDSISDGSIGFTQLYSGFNDLVGRNLTLDPLPVRVNIGHYIDIEPMVITSMKVTFSREQFVDPNGRHLPIFCSVNISFTSWMTPSPDLEFMQLLGKEMFGPNDY